MPDLRHLAETIWSSGLAAVNGEHLVYSKLAWDGESLTIADSTFANGDFDRLVVVGAGKCAGWMARGVERFWLESGLHRSKRLLGRVHLVDGDPVSLDHIHPVFVRPRNSNRLTQRTIDESFQTVETLNACTPRDLVLYLVAGGASAMLELPKPPLSWVQLNEITDALFDAHLSIGEVNSLRRQISLIKNGGLLTAASRSRKISLILSDVIGGPISTVGSGPTMMELTPFEKLMKSAQRLKRSTRIPEATLKGVLECLQDLEGPATHVASIDQGHRAYPIGDISTAVQGCLRAGASAHVELEAEIITQSEFATATASRLVSFVSRMRERAASRRRIQCWISGGEPVVPAPAIGGMGGRNTHLALDFALKLRESFLNSGKESEYMSLADRVVLGSIATDGEDGVAPCAGAVVDGRILRSLQEPDSHREAIQALSDYNSFPFFQERNRTLDPWEPKTNVCDLRVLLVGP